MHNKRLIKLELTSPFNSPLILIKHQVILLSLGLLVNFQPHQVLLVKQPIPLFEFLGGHKPFIIILKISQNGPKIYFLIIKNEKQGGQLQILKRRKGDRVLVLAPEVRFGVDGEHIIISDDIIIRQVQILIERVGFFVIGFPVGN